MRSLRQQFFAVFVCLAALGLLAGCGSNSSSTSPTGLNTAATPTANVLVNVGDAPGDRVISFTLTINSIALVPQSGPPVTVFSTPTQVEVTKLAGTTSPLGTANVPAGTYTGAQVLISNPVVAILNPDGTTKTVNLPAGPQTINVKFDAPVSAGSSSPTAINFDLRILGSVNIDSSGNVTFTPDFHGNGGPIAGGPNQGPFNGGVAHFGGAVSTIGSSSFTVAFGNQALTFTVNSATQFNGVAGLSGLTRGMAVFVDAKTQTDGSLLATAVRVLTINLAFSADGIVAAVNGNPATQLAMMFRDHVGMMGAPPIGTKIAVNVASAKFSIDNDNNFSLAGLPFTPAFDASNVFPGQAVEVHSSLSTFSPTAVPSITANDVALRPQALGGTPSNPNGSSFTLTVPSDGAFATLTGATTVTVFTTSQTQFAGTASAVSGLSPASKALVRGYLFFDQGQWKLVAELVAQ